MGPFGSQLFSVETFFWPSWQMHNSHGAGVDLVHCQSTVHAWEWLAKLCRPDDCRVCCRWSTSANLSQLCITSRHGFGPETHAELQIVSPWTLTQSPTVLGLWASNDSAFASLQTSSRYPFAQRCSQLDKLLNVSPPRNDLLFNGKPLILCSLKKDFGPNILLILIEQMDQPLTNSFTYRKGQFLFQS